MSYSPLGIYVAAPYEERAVALSLKARLESAGARVICTWLTPQDNQSMNSLNQSENKHRECQKRALKDIAEVKESDAIVLIKPEAWHRKPTTGGHHCEFMAAWLLGKQCVIMGDRENIFHYLPGVQVGTTVEDILHILNLV